MDNDPFNSHPSDPELMSEEVRKKAGETLETATKRITMIDLPLEQQKIVFVAQLILKSSN
jgi:Mg-chelatase subunit ChlI